MTRSGDRLLRGPRVNEWTGSGFNELQSPTDVVLLAVSWRPRYKLSFRDVAELLLQRCSSHRDGVRCSWRWLRREAQW